MIAVPFAPGTPPVVGAPQELFAFPATTLLTSGVALSGPFDVFPDGQQFIAVTPWVFEGRVSLAVTVNWTAGLPR